MGKFVCMFFCIVGIAIFGIPVGAIFEAFGDTLGERQEIVTLDKTRMGSSKEEDEEEEKKEDL